VFSALCGEQDPIGTSKFIDTGNRAGSSHLPDGLRRNESTRKCLFKDDAALTAQVRDHILAEKNKETFIQYLESAVSKMAFSKLQSEFSTETVYTREELFNKIFDQFMGFAKGAGEEEINVFALATHEISVAPKQAKK
jgi:hypothetical protein